jgi:methylmalonyl-CoA/ethylmalonyl-CoA epimerase
VDQLFSAIDHIGIAAHSIDLALPLYCDAFGMHISFREVVPQQGTEVAFLQCGESAVELVAPVTAESAVASFLAERGPGMHHIAYRVESVEAALQRCADSGMQLIDQHARVGAGGHLVAFLHPRSTGRVLIELVERRDNAPSSAHATIE